MAAGDTFFALRNFVKGKISRYELESADPSIRRVTTNSGNLGQSVVYVEFENSVSLMEIIGLDDNDSWFARVVSSSYDSYQFYETDTVMEDFKDGYGIFWRFNDENIELYKKIGLLLGLGKIDWEPDGLAKVGEKIYNIFPNEIENIIQDYTTERNSEMNKTAFEEIKKDMDEYLSKFGLEYEPYDGFKTTVANLISLYIQYNTIHLNLKKMFREIFHNTNETVGGWSDQMYEYTNDENFDSDYFNREVTRNLENIVEKLEDSPNFQEYITMVNRVIEKFNVDRVYKLPKNQDYTFQILGFDKEKNKIKVFLSGPNRYKKKFSVSEQGFNNLLYNLELFNLSDI